MNISKDPMISTTSFVNYSQKTEGDSERLFWKNLIVTIQAFVS